MAAKRKASRLWILSAVGGDRPGIVAQVTRALYRLGCNLEDSAMTRLGGEFAIMLVCSSAASLSSEQLDAALAPLAPPSAGLSIHVKPLAFSAPRRARVQSHVISVYGADRPGIVYRVAELLARRGVNITDLSTRRTESLYLMLLEVELPPALKAPALERALRGLAARLRVEVRLQPVDTEIL